MSAGRCLIAVLLLVGIALCVHAQWDTAELYWENPEVLVPADARFAKADEGGGIVFVVWQEIDTGVSGGRSYLSVKATGDGSTWVERRRIVGPFEYIGRPVSIFSITVDDKGTCYMAVTAGERRIEVYRTRNAERDVEMVASFELNETTVSPRLFVGSDGGLRLFVSKNVIGVQQEGATTARDQIGGTVAIYYTTSSDGRQWAPFREFVSDPVLSGQLHSLPHLTVLNDSEYVVFQAYVPSVDEQQISNQLYLKLSRDGGRTWTPARKITDFQDVWQGIVRNWDEFDNQNPYIAPVGNRIGLTWERSFGIVNPQIFYAELNPDGEMVGAAERVTQGVRSNRSPRIVTYQGFVFLVWFDNRAGADHVIMARRVGGIWVQIDLSENIPGISQFPQTVFLDGRLHLLWENRLGSDCNLVYLQPDQSVPRPSVTPLDFADGGRYASSRYNVRWSLPNDSSGIVGFAVSFNRDADGRPPREIMRARGEREMTLEPDEDGEWYFHVSARDAAGNWSPPSTVSVFRDTTAPGPVEFVEPEIDENGFVVSNTYTFEWNPPPNDDVAGYSYTLQYLSTSVRTVSYAALATRVPGSEVQLRSPELSIRNRDNGLWSLTVAPVDVVGNRGPARTMYIQLNKYIPVTYITSVSYEVDELGRTIVTVVGRGFSNGGNVSTMLVDRDRKPPWDYEYTPETGGFTVVSDRAIRGLVLEGLDRGDYYVGVVHPIRGVDFGTQAVAIAPRGRIKFGDFSALRPQRFFRVRNGRITVSFYGAVALVFIALLGFLIVFSIHRIAVVTREGKMLEVEVRALLTGETTTPERRERLKRMKKRGMGLRLKFSMFTILLVISTVLIVAFPLSIIMMGTEEKILADGLRERTQVLLNSVATTAKNLLPERETELVNLLLLPRQRQAVDAAVYVTVSGPPSQGVEDQTIRNAGSFDYVWATDDPNIAEKVDTEELQTGISRITDEITPFLEELRTQVNEEASAAVGGLRDEIDKIQAEQRELFSGQLTQEVQDLIAEKSVEIRELTGIVEQRLLEISDIYRSVPEYTVESLDRDNTLYVFYTPIVYQAPNDRQYYRGVVRLAVTTTQILQLIDDEQRTIVVTTGIVALIAIGIGMMGALLLASIIITPIRRLVQGVETIRDTEDKEELRGHVIDVRTRDEISALADTVNQMTAGLAEAAAANKDLILGKDTQKMFTPLEQDPSSGRKLTTADERNEHVEFFGYYEGAKGVSGDYFDYIRLDDKHYAIIKCDVAGKGVPASLIMVEVATIFLDYFRNWNYQKNGIHLDELAYRINDMVEQRGFKGRFATLMLIILNIETGASYFCNAGDKFVHLYDQSQRRMAEKELPESPAAGVFSTDLVEMGSGFQQVPHQMKPGDTLMLFTDGVEEDKRYFRDADFNVITCQGENGNAEEGTPHENHVVGADNEELGIPRIQEIVNAVMNRGSYQLVKHHWLGDGGRLDFDFSGCTGTVREAVLAMAAVDKVFRVYRHPDATAADRVRVDVKIDEFLRKHFSQYDGFFENPSRDERFPEYVYFSGLREDDQYDDLTILGVRKI